MFPVRLPSMMRLADVTAPVATPGRALSLAPGRALLLALLFLVLGVGLVSDAHDARPVAPAAAAPPPVLARPALAAKDAPLSCCRSLTACITRFCSLNSGPPVQRFDYIVTVDNGCNTTVNSTHTDYLEVSDDSLTWTVFTQTAALSISFSASSTTVFTGRFDVNLSTEIYYRIRTDVTENNCTTYQFYSIYDFVCYNTMDTPAQVGGGCTPLPPDEGPSGRELWGGGSLVSDCPVCHRGAPVDTAIGNFWHSFTDLTVPGRGPALLFARTYNAQDAATPGPLGYGWTHSYNMRVLTVTKEYEVHQENGSVAPFPLAGGRYARVLAELTRHPDQTFTFTRLHGRDRLLFDATGKLTAIADRNAYTTTLAYSATSGLLETVTDPAGRVLTFTYTLTSSTPFLTGVQDGTGRAVAFGYDTSGNLQTATDVAGERVGFTYDGSHRLLTMTNPRQGVVTNSYDAQSRVLTQTLPLTRTLQFAYRSCGADCTGTTVTDTLGVATVYTYDSNRLVNLVAAPGPTEARWGYSYSLTYPVGVRLAVDPNNNRWTYDWDGSGNLLSATDPLTRTTRYGYSALNDLVVVTDTASIPITYTRDITGNLLSVAQPLTQTGQVLTTTFGYNPLQPGDVLTVTNPLGKAWRYAYDSYGYVLSTTNPLTATTRFSHDALGRLLSVTSPRNYTSTLAYNSYGAPTRITDTLGYTTTYAYDGNRNLQVITNTLGYTTTYSYNLADELTRVTRADGTHSDYDYDGRGQVVTQTNGLGQSTRYDYDALGRVLTVTSPLTVTARYSYDQAGNLRVITDAAGLTTTLSYDAAYQLTGLSYDSDGPSTPNVTFGYDVRGLRTSMMDGTGTTTYTYDSLLRLTVITDGLGAAVGYGYDLAGRLTRLTYPNNGGGVREVTRTYDEATRQIELKDWLNNTYKFEYDADGNRTGLEYPNGVEASWSYDGADQLTALSYAVGGSPLLSLSYSRDGLGRLGTASQDGGASVNSYEYDPLSRLVGDGLSSFQTISSTWGYDGAYEITATRYQVGANTPITTTRSYNAGNQLLYLREGPQGGSLTRNLSLTYSPPGNRTQQQDAVSMQTTSYSYDQANRLTNYNGVKTYSYNGAGLRMTKSGPVAPLPFVWDVGAGLPLLLEDAGGSYIYGPGGELVGQIAGNDAYYYHADQLGSVRLLTDKGGAVVNSYAYDAYGTVTAASVMVGNPFGYAGEYTDAESGLVYLRARYYDPATQQFLTIDPIVAATEQAYNYAEGNPLNATDPSGLCCGTDSGMSWEGGGNLVRAGGGGSFTQPGWIDEFAHVWRGLFEPVYGGPSGPLVYNGGTGSGSSQGGVHTFWSDFINHLSGRVATKASKVTSAQLQTFVADIQGTSCALGYQGGRPGFWKSTTEEVISNAPQKGGLPVCVGCNNPIGQGNILYGGKWRRDFDIDHITVIWADRTAQIPANTPRNIVIELYNFGVRALCPVCNQGHRLEPKP